MGVALTAAARSSRSGSAKTGGTASLTSRSSIRCGSVAIGRRRACFGQLLEDLLRVDAVNGRELRPGCDGVAPPGKQVVLELDVEDLGKPFLQRRIHDGNHRLDAAIEVTRHEGGWTKL